MARNMSIWNGVRVVRPQSKVRKLRDAESFWCQDVPTAVETVRILKG